MFYERFKPTSIKDVRGNATGKKRLRSCLGDYDSHVGVIVSGPPGVGKDIAVECLARELGYHLEEIEDLEHLGSFFEDKKAFAIENILFSSEAPLRSELLQRGKKLAESAAHAKTVVFVRDYESFIATYPSGARLLCRYLKARKEAVAQMKEQQKSKTAKTKKTKVMAPPPLVVITCNDGYLDKIKSVRGYCTSNCIIRFFPVETSDVSLVLSWTIQQFRKTGAEWCWPAEYDGQCCAQLARSSKGDVRNALVILYMLYTKFMSRRDDDEEQAIDFTAMEEQISEQNMSLFDACDNMFKYPGRSRQARHRAFSDKLETAFQDPYRMPAMVHENYLDFPASDNDTLEKMAEAADSISVSDLMESTIVGTQGWDLQPHVVITGCVAPAMLFHRPKKKKERREKRTPLRFPGSFTLYSSIKKHQGELDRFKRRRVHLSMSLVDHSASIFSTDLDVIYAMLHLVIQPLSSCTAASSKREIDEAVEESYQRMTQFYFTRTSLEDLRSLCLIARGTALDYSALPPRIKSAMTRRISTVRKRPRPPPQKKKTATAPPPSKKVCRTPLPSPVATIFEDDENPPLRLPPRRKKQKKGSLLGWIIPKPT